jgi:hypothetical protein
MKEQAKSSRKSFNCEGQKDEKFFKAERSDLGGQQRMIW